VRIAVLMKSSRFSDVSLLCARTGVTQLPISTLKAAATPRSESMGEMSTKAKAGTVGRRSHSVRARNLYRVSRSLECESSNQRELMKRSSLRYMNGI
jgi:hypothetical protein